jgi:hypothetical protein
MRLCYVIVVMCSLLGQGDANSRQQTNLAIQWNEATLRGGQDRKLGPPFAARALAVVHTCMYDAWAAYDEHATGTQLSGAVRRPQSERTLANKEKAISYAAYRALVDVLPADTETVYKPLMKQLGYDPNDNSTDIETPAGIGNVACAAVLEFRHHDKSNQLGDLAQGSYADWTHFRPVNMPTPFPIHLPTTHPVDMNRWQPLIYVNSTGDFATQMFSTAHWCFVAPFALTEGDEFRSIADTLGPAAYDSKDYEQQAQELIEISANLTDQQKMIAEYWSDATNSSQVLDHWMEFAQWVSERDHHALDDDVKMFFVLSNTTFDASIAASDIKREYDSMRPVTALPLLFAGKKIRSWGGPGKGIVEIDGSQWIPYQPSVSPTPASPEFVSDESAISAAAASMLGASTRSDQFGHSVTLASGSSKIEPGEVPAHPIALKWDTFTEAANEAGMSQRYGGVHFRPADLAGRQLGRLVAEKVWTRVQAYFDGTAKPLLRQPMQMGQSQSDH